MNQNGIESLYLGGCVMFMPGRWVDGNIFPASD